MSLDKPKADEHAVKHIADPAMREAAVSFLAMGAGAITTIRDRIYLNTNTPHDNVTHASGQPITVSAPANLPTEPLAQLLTNPDAKLAAMAGYLLAISGSRDGFRTLESYWRGQAHAGDAWRKLMYRAITSLNDDALTPILEEIYGGMEKQAYEMREFYWTIRGMTGPNALALRKRVRDEVGMESLR